MSDNLTRRVLDEVAAERVRQTEKHGDQSHLPDGTGPDRKMRFPVEFAGCHTLHPNAAETAAWAKHRCKSASQNEGGDGSITFEHVLTEEWAEAIAESDQVALRAELIQVAAVAVQWIEAIDKRADAAEVISARTEAEEAIQRVLALAASWDEWPMGNFAEDIRAAVEGREAVHRR